LLALEGLRAARNRKQAAARRRQMGLPEAATLKNVFHLPLGYFNQVPPASPRPPAERTIDVFFAGGYFPSGGGRMSAGLRPRTFVRGQMTKALMRWKPPAGVNVRLHPSRPNDPPLDPQTYSNLLADAKIALCPRGNFPETFRTFEAARAGCVLVCDVQPDAWYYREMPGYQMPHWSRLPAMLERLLADPAELSRQHEASLRWWREVVSEEAVARRLIPWLESLRAVR
jgi:hypothetical protein